ncbi:Hypothetical protein PFR_JS21-2_1836 [Propionibacterium freudenreichii]|nr:Hypothetical protein PFR_JS4_1523 [Propionibacterium freudenreichii]SCQ57272.1 Hypothetical protein PFR_JS21-1_1837 [Propionibacterium freudenreichii]SCQ60467.1 Hypothetical protein PFR_JS25-1_1697 [Propionibacterium freudenreichii]SCQ64927.1 Hypothetical protein PFR_JS21-2_1836 [Propionibacterium freudenreichii]
MDTQQSHSRQSHSRMTWRKAVPVAMMGMVALTAAGSLIGTESARGESASRTAATTQQATSQGITQSIAVDACGQRAEQTIAKAAPALAVKAHDTLDTATLQRDADRWQVQIGVRIGQKQHLAHCTVTGSATSPAIANFVYW